MIELKGVKKDDGKVRIDLFPSEVIFAISSVLTFGANKYTQKFDTTWEVFWKTAPVVRQDLYILGDYVGHVTKNNLGKITLSLQNVNGKIEEIGKQIIQTEYESWLDVESKILQVEKEIVRQSGSELSENMESQKSFTKTKSLKDALSVVQLNTFTLITTIKVGNTEEYFVANTTTVLGSLEMTLKEFKKLSIISSHVGLLEITGERNWELGMKWGRVFGALMRHMWCWWGGKSPTSKSFLFGELDDETKFSHLWHAGCCIAFLITYEERMVGEDDRI